MEIEIVFENLSSTAINAEVRDLEFGQILELSGKNAGKNAGSIKIMSNHHETWYSESEFYTDHEYHIYFMVT